MAFHWLARHPLAVYEFRHLDACTGKWVRARYKASLDEIRVRYDRGQLIGPPEIRKPVKMFSPFGERTDPPLEMVPLLNETEQFLARLFLRRYITWCGRRRRFAQMQGAAQLYCEICVI